MILSHVFRNSMILGFFKWCFSFILLGGRLHFTICLEEFKARAIKPEEQMIYIAHGDCLEDAEYLKSLILSEITPKDIVINILGPIIGTHTGPGLVGVFFLGKER